MRGKTALIGFLVLQAAMLVFWLAQLGPLLDRDTPLIWADAQQGWSGGGFSNTTGSFRGDAGREVSIFQIYGHMLWGVGLIVASGVAAWFAGGAFHRDRTWISAALTLAALGLAAGGAYYVVTQWSGDTTFLPPAFDATFLYMATRTALIHLAISWVLMAIYAVLAIAGISNAGKPLGYHLVVLNWVIVVIVWVALYLSLYVVPGLTGGG